MERSSTAIQNGTARDWHGLPLNRGTRQFGTSRDARLSGWLDASCVALSSYTVHRALQPAEVVQRIFIDPDGRSRCHRILLFLACFSPLDVVGSVSSSPQWHSQRRTVAS